MLRQTTFFVTIALIVAASVYFQVVDVIVNEKLTHVIDEIDTIEKNIKIWRQIVKFLMELVKNGHIYNNTHAFL